jgi:hypothetical protein
MHQPRKARIGELMGLKTSSLVKLSLGIRKVSQHQKRALYEQLSS